MKKLLFFLIIALSMHVSLQAQVTKTITDLTAGTLTNTLTTEEKATITDITVTGNMDARDVKCMRDEMPLLAVIDMSAVNIQAYSGNEGTGYFNLSNYPANEMPTNSFESTDGYTFIGKTSLTSITLPTVLASIADAAFGNCTGLTNITIPDGVMMIGAAFSGCTGLTSITIPSGVLSIPSYTFTNCSGLTSVIIGSGVTTIGINAFYSCTSLTSLNIPDGVTSIGNSAFSDCTGLTSLTIGKGVTSIGDNVFNACTSLISLIIPDGVTSIGYSAFSGCTGLSSITLGTGLSTISDGAFYGCSSLKSIYSLKETPPTIGDNSFSEGVTDVFVTKLAAVTAYKANAGWFTYFPRNIIKKFIPLAINKTITNLEAGTLSASLTYEEKTTVTNLTLSGFIDASDIKCMRDQMTALSAVNLYATTVKEYIGSDGPYVLQSSYPANEIPETAFLKSTMSSIFLPAGVTSIAGFAFDECTELTNLNFPTVLTSIGGFAFSGCRALANISIPAGVNFIGPGAFADCQAITSLTIPNGVTSIENRTFNSCRKLANITIPAGVTKIGDYAFGECNALTTVSIPNSVTSIGIWAFGYCQSLESISLPSGITSILEGTFYDCYGIKSVNIPNGVTSIGFEAFAYCAGLTNLTIGSGVASIEASAFGSCSELKTIYGLNATPPSLGQSCFDGLSSITDVFVPTNNAVIDYKANANWIGFFPGDIIKTGVLTSTLAISNRDLKVYSSAQGITIEGASAGQTIQVYSANGVLVQTIQPQRERLTIRVNKTGVYFIKTPNKTFKVIL
ncbi:MAG: leucine-rich repeat domain-containing protein [Paludibacter sp.]